MNVSKLSIHHAKQIEIKREDSSNVDEPGEATTTWTTIVITDGLDHFELTLFGMPVVLMGDGFTDWTDTSKARELLGAAMAGRRTAEKVCDELRAELFRTREELAGECDAHMFIAGQLAEVNRELESWQNDEDLPEVKTLMNPLPPRDDESEAVK